MSDEYGVPHDTAARLIGLSPIELEKLARDGLVKRNDRNSYSVPVLVSDYVAHLKAKLDGTTGHPKQTEVAAHLDLSDRSVREWEDKLALPPDYTLADFRIAYIRRLREEAAGRATDGDLDLATERARLAREQADKVAMQNAVTRNEMAPVYLLEEVLAKAGSRAARILDTIPGVIRRREPSLSSETIKAIESDIAKVRNLCAAISLEQLREESDKDAFEECLEGPAPEEPVAP